ncbi:MAG: ABC transporter permease [Desulfurococcaceae archaeon]
MSGLLRRAYAVFKAYFLSEFARSRGFIYGLVGMALWITVFTMPIALFAGDDVNADEVAARIFVGIILFMFYGTASWDWAAELRWMINDGRIEYYIASGSGFTPHYVGILPVSFMWLGIALSVNYLVLSLLWSPPSIRIVDPLIFLYGFTLLLTCLIAYALILGGTMISSGVTGSVVEVISFILPIATGGLLPLRLMPEPLQLFALLTPFSYPAELVRYSMLGVEPVLELKVTILAGTLYVLVFLVLGVIYFKYQLKRAVREGFKTISMW